MGYQVYIYFIAARSRNARRSPLRSDLRSLRSKKFPVYYLRCVAATLASSEMVIKEVFGKDAGEFLLLSLRLSPNAVCILRAFLLSRSRARESSELRPLADQHADIEAGGAGSRR